ncbi:hypothetical protein ACFY9S_39525 [Streptomyces sp. NPDC012474]|jgi:hypothetical protein|uniref:hypothetical protein n=1 Tax=Streptomyces sp. NPDC012474 TaxID=3364836 RepID=UPI0036E08CD2
MAAKPYLTDAPETLEHSPDFYATALTLNDVEELRAFLEARCDEVYGRYRPDTSEARMVQAFYEAVGNQLDELADLIADRNPEKLSARATAWDCLMHIVAPWRGIPGHNGERWRTIHFPSELDRAKARATVHRQEAR